jgi:hypothetical protein
MVNNFRTGIDVGGTKLESIVLDDLGEAYQLTEKYI